MVMTRRDQVFFCIVGTLVAMAVIVHQVGRCKCIDDKKASKIRHMHCWLIVYVHPHVLVVVLEHLKVNIDVLQGDYQAYHDMAAKAVQESSSGYDISITFCALRSFDQLFSPRLGTKLWQHGSTTHN